MIDFVHKAEEIIGADAVLGHHAAHGGAVAAVIVLLDPPCLFRRDIEVVADKRADPRIDLLPQIDVMRIERVVEIEHPGVDVVEATCWFHGIAKRRVLPPLDRSTGAKPVVAKPPLAQSPWSVISNLLSRVQSCFTPPQLSGLSLSLTVRLSASTASAQLKICFRAPLTSGCRHLPGSIRYQPRLMPGLASSAPTAAMTLCGVSLHHVSPVGEGACTASIMVEKKFADCTTSDDSPWAFKNDASAACVF